MRAGGKEIINIEHRILNVERRNSSFDIGYSVFNIVKSSFSPSLLRLCWCFVFVGVVTTGVWKNKSVSCTRSMVGRSLRASFDGMTHHT